jgi:hypothetical protein
MLRTSRFPRSAGTATPLDVIRRGFRSPTKGATDADIAAVDRGEGRTVACFFRGQYGGCPRRFRRKMLDLTPDGLILRPFWSSPSRSRFRIKEAIVSAGVRQREGWTDLNVPMTGAYRQGGLFDYAGFETIHCETSEGVVELAVPRPDIPLVLHYLRRR